MIIIRYIAFIILCSIFLNSCNKESFYEGKDAKLLFSSDTVSFDTVFTSFGSETKQLMVYNPYNQSLKINTIALSGSQSSVFLINVDGISSAQVNNIEIKPKDSLYIFLQVFINPVGSNLPMIVKDSIMFNVNNKIQYVQLEAFGQNVHFYNGVTLKSQTWPADKPYLIYGNITVDTLQTLTIAGGAVVYMNRNANLRVKGTLIANGSFLTPVQFNTDRLDKDYSQLPSQWGGIAFLPGSKNNVLNWLIIKNGISGITIGRYNDNSKPDLTLSNSIIVNMSYCCLCAINSTVKAWNCVIADAGTYTCGLLNGGDYQFYQCTLANYYNASPALTISDTLNPLTANFTNTIISDSIFIYQGINDTINELQLPKNNYISSCVFKNCLIEKQSNDTFNSNSSINNILNKNPKFKNPSNFDFEIDSLSAAIEGGDINTGLLYPYDLKNVNRTLNPAPDIGAYQWVKK